MNRECKTTGTGLEVRVQAMIDRLRREDVCMHGFILSVGGEIIASADYAPFRADAMHRMYSVSKTMTALAIGILMGEGKLGTETRIAEHFADMLPEQPDERLLRLTIGDMLRMATCYRRSTYREGIDENWAATFFTAEADHEPGTVFSYDTSCSQVLASLVRRLSGQDVLTFLNERVFGPLGMNDERIWLCDPSGERQGGTGLCMSLRDMHRVSQMVMRGGEGLVPEAFIRQMTAAQIDTPLRTNEEERYGYGWQCWRTRCGYSMYGLGGQLAVCCPDKDALLCTTADTRLDPCGVQRIYNAFFEEVYPYIGEESMQPKHWQETAHAPMHCPEYAQTQAGPYAFAPNRLSIERLEVKEGRIEMVRNGREQVLRFGLGENIVTTFPGWDDVPAMSGGGYSAPGVLRVKCFAIGKAPCGIDLRLYMTPEYATVEACRSSDPVTEGYDGTASGRRCR